MFDNWRARVGVSLIMVSLSGCTAILGDFASGEGIPDASDSHDASQSPEASDPPESSRPDVMTIDGAPGIDASGDDSSTGCGAGQLSCAAGCVSANDIHTCGSCMSDCTQLPHVSPLGLGCNAGACQYMCQFGYAHCSSNPSDVCETDLSEAAHCGNCMTACGGSTPVCTSTGTSYGCVSGCPSGTEECSGSCANLSSDDGHCGSCANACTGGKTCQSSQCACPAPLTECSGTCYSTQDDATHCGASCVSCPVPANGRATCGGGTCGTSCNAGFSACGTATPCAYDTNNDGAHCGPNCTACGSGEVCSQGSCVCAPGYQNCGGGCTDTSSDPSNCGTCGHVCSSGGCNGGGCTCTQVVCGSHLCGCAGTCCSNNCCAPP
jgi:hypothetical protein